MSSPDSASNAEVKKTGKGAAFWLTFFAVLLSTLLSALDMTAVGTALPTITEDLSGGNNYVWVGSAYALSSTAILPLSGRLADIFGRRPLMLSCIVLFALGSALAGAAQNMNMMIAARTIQGIGGGGILNLSEIIVADLVSLAERGMYQGIVALTWAFASGIGPPIGGAFAERASWRWLFYLNLPLCGLAFVFVLFFLRVRTPEGTVASKIKRVDWFGNLIVIAGTTLAIVGLTFGGAQFPWVSAQVLAPLIIGLALIGAFLLYEAKVPVEPTIPWEVVSNRTSLGGFLGTLVQGITSISLVYYGPVYFQACLLASPIRSGVDMFPTALVVAPFAFTAGILIHVSKRYIPANIIAWVMSTIGFGLLSLLKYDTPTAKWVGYQIIAAAGTGMLYTSTVFPVLAPLGVEHNAAALGLFSFLRSFAMTWGLTISSTIIQNQLKKNISAEVLVQFPQFGKDALAFIPLIRQLPEGPQTEIRAAFASSMSVLWKTMIGISGLGLITVALMKEIQMKDLKDEKYGLHDGEKSDEVKGDEEKGEEKVDEVEVGDETKGSTPQP